ncbi:hypothetical protein GCM10023319_19680 [Nocardia iowensis]
MPYDRALVPMAGGFRESLPDLGIAPRRSRLRPEVFPRPHLEFARCALGRRTAPERLNGLYWVIALVDQASKRSMMTNMVRLADRNNGPHRASRSIHLSRVLRGSCSAIPLSFL